MEEKRRDRCEGGRSKARSSHLENTQEEKGNAEGEKKTKPEENMKEINRKRGKNGREKETYTKGKVSHTPPASRIDGKQRKILKERINETSTTNGSKKNIKKEEKEEEKWRRKEEIDVKDKGIQETKENTEGKKTNKKNKSCTNYEDKKR